MLLASSVTRCQCYWRVCVCCLGVSLGSWVSGDEVPQAALAWGYLSSRIREAGDAGEGQEGALWSQESPELTASPTSEEPLLASSAVSQMRARLEARVRRE